MNAVTLPIPLAVSDNTVTLSRAAWETLMDQVEDATDLATVAASDARRATIGEEAFARECISGEEAARVLDGASLVTIYRERAKMTQRALAQSAGVSPAYLNEVEKGRKPGSAAALKKLAAALGVSMEVLVR